MPATFSPLQVGHTVFVLAAPPVPPTDTSGWFAFDPYNLAAGTFFSVHGGLRFDVGGERDFIAATVNLTRGPQFPANPRDHLKVWLRNDPVAPAFSTDYHSGVVNEILAINPLFEADPLWIQIGDVFVDEGQLDIPIPLDLYAMYQLALEPTWNGIFSFAVTVKPTFGTGDAIVSSDLVLELADRSEVEELMARIDVTTAAVRALVAHLEANLPAALADESQPTGTIAYVHEGWESQDEDMMFPSVVVNAMGMGERTGNSPLEVESVFDPNPNIADLTCRLLVASIDVSIAIDVFAESPTQRAEVCHAIEVALQVGVVAGEDSGLIQLIATDYFNLTFSYRRTGTFQHTDTSDEVGGEMWRAHAEIECGAQEVANVEAVRFIDMSVDHRIGEVTRPDDITAGEVKTVFEPS